MKCISIKYVVVVFSLCLFVMNQAVSAAEKSSSGTVGIVVIGTVKYKIPEYSDFIKSKFKPYNVTMGDEVQSQYMRYWVDKERILAERPLGLEDMCAFAKTSSFDKVLYIIVGENETEKVSISSSLTLYNNAIDVLAVLCDKNKIVARQTFHAQKGSRSPANNTAFKECIKKVAKEYEQYL